MKIVKFHAENIKKLRVVSITPSGSVVRITGPNGSGKSSTLDALYWALAGQKAIESKPIREGEESALINLDLGEFTVVRGFKTDEDGGKVTTKVEVITAAGAKFPSPQKMLDALLGSLTFDPLEFSRADAKAQLDMLRSLVPLDLDIDELDLENRRDFEARTAINRDLKALEAQINGFGIFELPDEPESVASLITELEKASEHNRAVDMESRRRGDHAMAIRHGEQRVAKLEQDLADAKAEVQMLLDEQQRWGDAEGLVDVRALRERIDGATEARAVYDAAKRRADEKDQLQMKLDHIRITSEEFTAAIGSRHSRRMNAIAKAKMPVDGLGFGDGEVTYNGHPFAQASGAEQLRVSVAIAMAGNPKLRVLRIKDGSLLDSKSLALLEEMAELNDFQVWIESVDESGTVGIVMEDGAVASVNT